METRHLFVYGTLRRGSKNKFARLLHAHAQFAGRARIAGRLYRLSSYPGAIAPLRADEWVCGELYHLESARWVLAALDKYEGLDFRRATVKAQLEWGGQVESWVYTYQGSRPGSRIFSGDWQRP